MYKKNSISKKTITDAATLARHTDRPKSMPAGDASDVVFDPVVGRMKIVYEMQQ